MAENKIFSDLDLSFVPNPWSGDLSPKINQEALKRAVRNALQLNPFDIPFNPFVKTSLNNWMFDQNNQVTRAALVSELQWLFQKIEPRIEVQSIVVDPYPKNPRSVSITITYKIKSMNQIDSFNVIIEKVR